MLIENPLHEIKTLPTNFFFFNRLFSKSSFRELLGGPKVRTHHSHCRAQVPLLGELKFRVHQNFFGAAKKKKVLGLQKNVMSQKAPICTIPLVSPFL